MINCPVGTYMPTRGAASFNDCLPCTAGSYCLEGVFEVSGDCLPGYYCPSPIDNPYNTGVDLLGPLEIGSYGDEQVRSVTNKCATET